MSVKIGFKPMPLVIAIALSVTILLIPTPEGVTDQLGICLRYLLA